MDSHISVYSQEGNWPADNLGGLRRLITIIRLFLSVGIRQHMRCFPFVISLNCHGSPIVVIPVLKQEN